MRVKVTLWDKTLGYLADDRGVGIFQYAPEWLATGIEVSPLLMPLSMQQHRFPELVGTRSFAGLPGLIADALPEKFGNRILSAYLADHGRSFADLSALERLSYLGNRGMGALEFQPDKGSAGQLVSGDSIEIDVLAAIAEQVLSSRQGQTTSLEHRNLDALVQIGTSAGGAKAKAVIGWNPQTNEVVAGQGDLPPGFEHWLLKFDAIDNEEHATAINIGRIEFAYHLMAQSAGIDMMPCRLFEAGEHAHFMTQRFDRMDNQKFHVQSFAGLAHADRDPVGRYGYEDLFITMRRMGLGQTEIDEMYRRMAFNILTRNQDDHTKNHAFLMDAEGTWILSPAYDLCFSYKPGNRFIEQHQMNCNGKRDDFEQKDLLQAAQVAGIARPQEILDQVAEAASNWPAFADQAGLPVNQARAIHELFRMELVQTGAFQPLDERSTVPRKPPSP